MTSKLVGIPYFINFGTDKTISIHSPISYSVYRSIAGVKNHSGDTIYIHPVKLQQTAK